MGKEHELSEEMLEDLGGNAAPAHQSFDRALCSQYY